MYVGTNKGLYALDLATGIKNKGGIPFSFTLYQNYPNPFNPSTIISYDLSTKVFVTLKIYDALGREITTLVSAEQPAGRYQIKFDGSGLSSGVYFYKITGGTFTSTKKMLLLR